MLNFKQLKEIKGDASFRKFYRNKKNRSIVVHARKEKIKNLKNFASLDKSFKEWLTTCPKEYIWQIDEVTKDHEGTFTFRRTNGL